VYAQAHPTEDFAETFAVWLKPNSVVAPGVLGWPRLPNAVYRRSCEEILAMSGAGHRSKRGSSTSVASAGRCEHYEHKLPVSHAALPAPMNYAQVFTATPRRGTAPKAVSCCANWHPAPSANLFAPELSEYLVHQVCD